MSEVRRVAAIAAFLALLFIYLSGISSMGLIGPDEPRYASIGREMARSGDWITPTLWGAPWFEKPPLLYWMIAASFRLGVPQDWAPRLPVALFSVAFLVAFFFLLRREFGGAVAALATGILSTSALWMGFSHAAATDLPMAATFSLAVLLLSLDLDGGPKTLYRVLAGALLGLSVLAKAFVPLVLVVPYLWFTRARWRSWFHPAGWIAFGIVAVPWFALVTLRHGGAFWNVFLFEHQLGRFASSALQHVQPFWFYVPVVLVAMLPWTLFVPFAVSRGLYQDRRLRFLGAVFVFGFIFFSASRNKLPGYVLPLLPPLAILIAAGMDRARASSKKALTTVAAASTLLLPLFVIAAGILPRAFSGSDALFPIDLLTASRVGAVVPLIVIAGAAMFFFDRARALALLFTLVVCGWVYLEWTALPWLDHAASARAFWGGVPEPKGRTCVSGELHRNWRYGLNYYAERGLPECGEGNWANRIVPGPGGSGPVIQRED